MTKRRVAVLAIVVSTCACAAVLAPSLIGGGSRPTGRLIMSNGGADVSMLDLGSKAESLLTRFDVIATGVRGVSDILGEEVFFSVAGIHDTSAVFALNLRTSCVQSLGRGLWPAVCKSQESVVYFGDVNVALLGIPILCRRKGQELLPDTLGYVSGRGFGGLPWRQTVSAPVDVGDGWMATLGPDGRVQRVNVVTKQWVPIAGDNLLPRFWQATTRRLVCEKSDALGYFVAISLDNGEREELHALKGMVAYGPSSISATTLAVVPGWPLLFADTWSLKLYDWQTRRTRTVVPSFHCSGRMTWIE